MVFDKHTYRLIAPYPWIRHFPTATACEAISLFDSFGKGRSGRKLHVGWNSDIGPCSQPVIILCYILKKAEKDMPVSIGTWDSVQIFSLKSVL